MIKARKIELLAPAKNLECGIEAINHGADAVYIGAPKFSARAAAGNTLEDIRALTEYAHIFGVKVYVALNTILSDNELQETEKLIWQLYKDAKIDALIIQDMGITMLNLPPIALHASTQMDNRGVEKVKFLEDAGFKQIVLPRELTIDEIGEISSQVNTPLEVFVHGALCVCYSGQCYLSQALSGRSANKGACAQYCRLPYTLIDTDGEEIISKKHFLSMKDLNLSENIEELLNAGVSSLKIEGRLKDISYVKNIVAFYRQKLDKVLNKYPQYIRSSSGTSSFSFEPVPEKSFNRGFTKYFLHDRTNNMWSIDSPKSVGEPIGKITEITTKYIKINSTKKLHNGDGLCFFNNKKELEGIHVNRVEGELIFPATIPDIKKGAYIYRNYDHEFEKLLSKKSAERKISTTIELIDIPLGFSLKITDEDDNYAILNFEIEKQVAQKDQTDNIKNNLSKTGTTIFKVEQVNINWNESWFIPASVLSEWRRLLTDKLLSVRKIRYRQDIVIQKQTSHSFPVKDISYLGNVMNSKGKQFYIQHQSTVSQAAFEKQTLANVPLMFTRHCIKQSLGWCPKEDQEKHPYKEPFFLSYNNTRLRLSFDCKNCEMKVFSDSVQE
ncbi:U32 family peptidase [Dysgonomonas sp. Marseille-P4677]|uniref:peptidase U32 family protein n=1 Tax=Dysgonomonas sp. Marseille-P4677 TaxID=2364790 RepID=UPI0019133332|nr:U32 family peptidase [Dysgonomonas sp. Marseille-P4677]MBK5722661.1 U32 family peptidase [Dysgonomonas sp. Marseille-P4677]